MESNLIKETSIIATSILSSYVACKLDQSGKYINTKSFERKAIRSALMEKEKNNTLTKRDIELFDAKKTAIGIVGTFRTRLVFATVMTYIFMDTLRLAGFLGNYELEVTIPLFILALPVSCMITGLLLITYKNYFLH